MGDMMFARRWAYGCAAAVLALAAAPAVYAQVTTGGVTGRVTDSAGKAVAGATVVVRHDPSGTTTTTVTNADGVFTVLNQRVGGPYSVTVTAPDYQDTRTEISSVAIGDPTSADIVIAEKGANAVGEVIVTAVRSKDTMGPQTRITLQDVNTLPSLSRDIKDFLRKSPYVVLDPTNNNALIIGGQNNRANTVLIDGVKQSDDFGLNANGYPTQRSPISLSVVQALNVDVAPYDVQYDEFQGGVVNIVTKSGGNAFHGEAFYEFDNNHLRGQDFIAPNGSTTKFTTPFSEKTWGATVSGPIIPDKLFFVLNYEAYDSNQPSSFGPTDSNASVKVPDVTTAEAAQVRSILQTKYGYDPQSFSSNNLPIQDRKVFAKLDWNITDNQRAVFEYQHTDGAAQNNTGESTSSTSPSLALLSKWYNLDTDLTVYTGQLFSKWTDNFSTELSYSHKQADNVSQPLAGTSFAQFQVYMPGTVFNANGSPVCTAASPCPSIFLGPDISRQANVLDTTTDELRLKADYHLGNHTITAGLETERDDIFNLFVQNANGAYVFNSITDLQAGNAFSLKYQSAADNNKNDGAAQFSFMTNSAYLQDEWAVTPDLTVRAGLRYDWYTSSDKPLFNQAFQSAYGYTNNKNLDGMSVLQPRVGFDWRPKSGLSVFGGFGLFQGGTPNVWVSDSYSNPGNLIGVVTCNTGNQAANCPGSLTNVNGTQVGAGAKGANTASANAGTGSVNAIAPGFEPASIWKASVGFRYDFDLEDRRMGSNWHFGGDFINSQVNNALYWQDVYQGAYSCAVTNACSGATVAPDGRPEYGSTLAAGQTLYGTNARQNRQDVVLFDTNRGFEREYTLWIEKDWKDGWAKGLNVSYSFTSMWAQDVNPGTSSVATSNFREVAATNFNGQELSNSNYLIKYDSKLAVEYGHAWWGDNMTRIGLFMQDRTGLPFSYTFQDSNTATAASSGMFGQNSLYTTSNNQLMYVPQADSTGNVTLTSDPKVAYAAGFNISGFNTFLHTSGLIKYAGTDSPRNGFFSKDVITADLHFSQEFPAFIPGGAKVEGYLDIINLGNLIDKKWGVLEQTGFPYFLSPIIAQNCQAGFATAASCLHGNGNYFQYNAFNAKFQSVNTPSVTANTATWQVKLGIRYRF
jgi:outer membrane receptor for ferrienterochelin and colicin